MLGESFVQVYEITKAIDRCIQLVELTYLRLYLSAFNVWMWSSESLFELL